MLQLLLFPNLPQGLAYPRGFDLLRRQFPKSAQRMVSMDTFALLSRLLLNFADEIPQQ
jgi:hypothetical protein